MSEYYTLRIINYFLRCCTLLGLPGSGATFLGGHRVFLILLRGLKVHSVLSVIGLGDYLVPTILSSIIFTFLIGYEQAFYSLVIHLQLQGFHLKLKCSCTLPTCGEKVVRAVINWVSYKTIRTLLSLSDESQITCQKIKKPIKLKAITCSWQRQSVVKRGSVSCSPP